MKGFFYDSSEPNSLRSYSNPPAPFFWSWGIFIYMKILITENRLKSIVKRILGYDLSDNIEIITSWYELDSGGQRLFSDGKEEFNWLLNHYGPMFLFNVNGDNYYVQPQGKELGTLVLSDRKNRKIKENDFLKIIGLDILGISLNKLIDEFAEE